MKDFNYYLEMIQNKNLGSENSDFEKIATILSFIDKSDFDQKMNTASTASQIVHVMKDTHPQELKKLLDINYYNSFLEYLEKNNKKTLLELLNKTPGLLRSNIREKMNLK